MNETKLLRVTEVARLFNVSKPTVYRMVSAGHLEAYTICGSVRVPAEAVSRYLDQHRVTGGRAGSEPRIETTPATPAPPAASETPPPATLSPGTASNAGPGPSARSTATKQAKLAPRGRSKAEKPSAEMMLERKAWKIARTLALRLLPANADSAQWERTLKLAYAEARKHLHKTAAEKTAR